MQARKSFLDFADFVVEGCSPCLIIQPRGGAPLGAARREPEESLMSPPDPGRVAGAKASDG
jgi:hypothetical protein